MSETEQKPREAISYTPTAAEGYYVYCIAHRAPALELLRSGSVPSAMEENTRLEVIAVEELAAIVSRVPLSVFGEESLDAHLSDAPWVTVRAMRHEQVVEHFARQTSVVPLRFGTIYLDKTSIKQMLADKEAQLHVILERVKVTRNGASTSIATEQCYSRTSLTLVLVYAKWLRQRRAPYPVSRTSCKRRSK